jgi:glycosyltransferase involved in cell wall biosynthesis
MQKGKEVNAKYRILMFSPAFAPFGNAEAIVNSKLALVMLNAGWEVDIISRDLLGQSSYDYGSSWDEPWLPLKKNTHEISYPLGNNYTRWVDTVWCALHTGYPIDGCRWAMRAYKKGWHLHNRKPYDVILSRAFPEYAHQPALMLARKTRIPWIANWNDPWAFLYQREGEKNLRKNLGYFHGSFIKAVAGEATQLTFPAEKLMKQMCECLNLNSSEKSSVVPHVSMPGLSTKPYLKKDSFTICYAGKLWPEQDTTTFLLCLKKIVQAQPNLNIFFEFIGIDDTGLKETCAKIGIDSHVRILGKENYKVTMAIISQADALLVIDPPSTKGMLLTSKFVDYAQTGRPILALTEPNGTLYTLLKKCGGGIAADANSFSEIYSALQKMIYSWQENTLDEKYASSKLSSMFSQQAIIKKITNIISSVRCC